MTTRSADAVPERKRLQMSAVRVSIAGSVTLFFIAAGVGIAVDSVTLILDASANLVVLTVAFLMSYAINRIHKPADKTYNFGYTKYEPLIASVQGLLIFATCAFAVKFAIQDIVHAEDIKNHLMPVIATFVSSIIGVFIVLYLRALAKRTGSSMLHAAFIHWRADTILSFGICFGFIVGMVLQLKGFTGIAPYFDPVMAIILALILVAAPARTFAHNVGELLDAVPAGDIHERIKKVLDTRKPDSMDVHRIRSRKAGEKIFLDITLSADKDLTIAKAEELTNILEEDIKSELGNCDIVVCFKSNKPPVSYT